MNWVDYSIIVIIGLSTLLSFFRGFARELLAILNWLLAIGASVYVSPLAAEHIFSFIDNQELRLAISVVVIFCVVFLLGLCLVLLISKIIDNGQLSLFNRLLGSIFGFVRGVLLVGLVLFIIQFFQTTAPNWWQQSYLIGWSADLDSTFMQKAHQKLDDFYHHTDNSMGDE